MEGLQGRDGILLLGEPGSDPLEEDIVCEIHPGPRSPRANEEVAEPILDFTGGYAWLPRGDQGGYSAQHGSSQFTPPDPSAPAASSSRFSP